jgi:hypothetical protein
MSWANQGVSAFSKDLLALVWANPGITSIAAGTQLGRDASTAMCNLHNTGLLQRNSCEVQGRIFSRWTIADPSNAQRALLGKTLERCNSVAYERHVPDPDFSRPPEPMPVLEGVDLERAKLRRTAERAFLSAKQAELARKAEPRVSQGPAPRARQEPPSFNCDARRHPPVVRAGSLDALRLRSLRWGTDRGTPEVRMAVVEAKGSAS